MKKLSSFVRQLHLYDFHKNKNKHCDSYIVFSNDLFKKFDRYIFL